MNPIDNLPLEEKLIVEFQMSMAFRIDSDCMSRVMAFTREMCEIQKRNILDLQLDGSIRNTEAEKCKNVCD